MIVERPDIEARIRMHAALADPHRLRIVDLLALTDLTPSELGDALGIGSNLVAHHLGVLEGAGLVQRLRSAGDGRRRYLRLVEPAIGESSPDTIVAERVLFVCTGNSARSQLAEVMWRRSSDVPAESAGTHPVAAVHPLAVRAGERAGLDLRGARPRTLDDVGSSPDLVVTVCDRAHEEFETGAQGTAPVLHWSIPDPRAIGRAAAFDDTVRELGSRIDRLAPHVVPPPRPRSRRRTRP
jgi:protein-tyrosine-phosphatase